MDVVGGSSSVWYSEDPGLEGSSAQKIPILLELAPVQREYSTVRATCLSPWKLLLEDWSRAGREILSILQGRQRSTNLAEKSSENTLRIPVSGGYLNTTLLTLSMVSTIS